MKSTTAKKLLAVGAVLAFAAVSTGCDYDADDLFYRHPQHHHHRYHDRDHYRDRDRDHNGDRDRYGFSRHRTDATVLLSGSLEQGEPEAGVPHAVERDVPPFAAIRVAPDPRNRR